MQQGLRGSGADPSRPVKSKSIPLMDAASDAEMDLPDMDDLRARLRFSPRDGRIWLDDQRMLLIHLSSITSLRRELIDSLGTEKARGLLTRMGYASGSRDAVIARKVRPEGSYFDILAVGPQLHALEGVVSVRPARVEVDVAKGIYYGEFIWHDSSEVDAHVAVYGASSDPVCWMQIGYACGYTSGFMGRPILYREVECRAMGHRDCRIIGKPVEEWDDPEEDLRFLHFEPFHTRSIHQVRTPSEQTPAGRVMTTAGMDQLVGASSGFIAVCHMLQKVAMTGATVLFLGETGVGKEIFARTLHRVSNRADKPFIAINCAAIPDNLVEAELFGVEKGAFTGALQSRQGRFERADTGTLFLDEVGTLNLTAQGKLLRALQEREIERVGDVRIRKVDVRVIAATNVDLRDEVKAGRFREDLLFRLNVFPIRIPPLRERRDDIPVLMDHFLKKFSTLHGRTVTGFTERAVDALLEYGYPGNIRELENMIERAIILVPDGGALDIGHLFTNQGDFRSAIMGIGRSGTFENGRDGAKEDCRPALKDLIETAIDDETPLEQIENLLIQRAVDRAGGNLSQAARILGMTRPQLAYRFNKER